MNTKNTDTHSTKLKDAAWSLSDIYLEDRYSAPKHGFTMVRAMLNEHFAGDKNFSLLDVGTAEGAFPHYLHQHMPSVKMTGLEFDPKLVKLANEKVKACKTVQGDANDLSQFADKSFDSVTCLGVLSIFDDYRPAMNEMLRVIKDGGLLLVNNMWNAFPVDLNIKVRHARPGQQDSFDGWEAGWNMVSLATMSAYLDHHERVQSFDFTKVVLPYDLPARPENCIRSWTNMGADNERYHMNGIGRLLDKRVLRVQIRPAKAKH